LLTRGPYCHPLTRNETGGFGRGSDDFFDEQLMENGEVHETT